MLFNSTTMVIVTLKEWNIIKHAGKIKEKSEIMSTFCGLQTATRNRSETVIEMECFLAVWIKDCDEKHIPLSKVTM